MDRIGYQKNYRSNLIKNSIIRGEQSGPRISLKFRISAPCPPLNTLILYYLTDYFHIPSFFCNTYKILTSHPYLNKLAN